MKLILLLHQTCKSDLKKCKKWMVKTHNRVYDSNFGIWGKHLLNIQQDD